MKIRTRRRPRKKMSVGVVYVLPKKLLADFLAWREALLR